MPGLAVVGHTYAKITLDPNNRKSIESHIPTSSNKPVKLPTLLKIKRPGIRPGNADPSGPPPRPPRLQSRIDISNQGNSRPLPRPPPPAILPESEEHSNIPNSPVLESASVTSSNDLQSILTPLPRRSTVEYLNPSNSIGPSPSSRRPPPPAPNDQAPFVRPPSPLSQPPVKVPNLRMSSTSEDDFKTYEIVDDIEDSDQANRDDYEDIDRRPSSRLPNRGYENNEIIGSETTVQRQSLLDFEDAKAVPTDIDWVTATIEDISHLLKLLGFDHHVQTFQDKMLDGALLITLDEKILMEEFVFNIGETHTLFAFLSNDWRPN